MNLLRLSRRSIRDFAAGDILIVIGFVLVGELSHGVRPWTVPTIVAETAATFLVGWIIVAPLVWAYQRSNRYSLRSAIGTALAAWMGAAAVANLIRLTALVHGNASLSFYLVSVVAGGAMLGVWRLLRVRQLQD